MAQYARPNGDYMTNNWAYSEGSNRYGCIDEETPDDGDYIYSDTDEDIYVCYLSDVTDPSSDSDHTVRWRWQSTGSSPPTETCSVHLMQGAVVKATCVEDGAVDRGGFADESYTLSSAEADSITDYTDLRLRFWITRTGSGEEVQISWAELEVPDAPGPGGDVSNLTLLGVG